MRKYKLWMQDIVFTEENIFFSAGQFNGLFRAGLHSSEAEFISFFPNDPKMQARLHGNAFLYKDEILFLPDLSDYITLYNIRTGSFECMKFPIEDKNPSMKFFSKIVAGILYGSCVYAFGTKYPCIIRYDFETRSLKVYDEGPEIYKKYGYNAGMVFFSRDICQVGKLILVRTFTNDVIVEFNTETEEITFHQTGKQLLNVLCCDDEKIWLIEKDEKILCSWDRGNGILLKLETGLERADQNYQCSIVFRNEIWLFPFLSDLIVTVNKQSGKSEIRDIIALNENILHKNDSLGAVWFRKIHKGKLYFMSVLENKLYCFNNEEKEEFCIDIYTDRTKLMKLLFQSLDGYVLKEELESLWGVRYDLIDRVMLESGNRSKQEREQIEFGKVIYDFLSQ